MKTNPNDSVGKGPIVNRPDTYNEGLTKREHFAALALQGMLSNPTVIYEGQNDNIAESAVIWADLLIAKLNDENP